MNNLISVIIPAFNAEKYIAQSIENALFQSYKNLEIIVINDGSTDKTAEIAEHYPVKLINQENRGLSAARNVGVENATGEYIHFFDADDLINTDFYQNMLSAILFADANIACSGVWHEKEAKKNTFFSEKIIAVNAEDKLTLCKVLAQGYVVKYLFKKSFLLENELKFHVGRFIEDMFFSFQAVFLSNKVITAPNAVYYYKYRQNSITANKNRQIRKKRRADWKFAYQFCLDFAQTHGLPPITDEQMYWTEYKFLGIPFLKKRESESGKTRWYLFGLYIFQKKYIKK
jgi:glycosyltransferase involved in cell wall biosynthesis